MGDMNYKFYNLTLTKIDGTSFSTYIYTDKVNISYIS